MADVSVRQPSDRRDVESPEFSIVTPTFQAAAHIEQCIRSGQDQGIAVQHVVQDAHSTDATASIARALGADIDVRRDDGMYDALNIGLARSSGRYLTHLNADEQLLPGALETARRVLEAADERTVVSGDVVLVDLDLEPIAYRRATPMRRWRARLMPVNSVLTAGTFYPRSLLEDGLLQFDASYRVAGDKELFCRLVERGIRWKTIPAALAVFVLTGENLSLSRAARSEGEFARGRSQRAISLGRIAYWAEKAARGGYRRRDVALSLYDKGCASRRTIEAHNLDWRWRWGVEARPGSADPVQETG